MGKKPMCELGMKKRKQRLDGIPEFECKKCGTEVKKKDWLCKPAKL